MSAASKIRWLILFPFIVVTVLCGLATEMHIGTIPVPVCVIFDQLHIWTTSVNDYFHAHGSAANLVLLATSLLYDFCIFFIMARSLYRHSFDPFLGLVFFFLLRQGMQLLVALPIPEGLIWHYPGFPSFFVFYGISNDLYFSAHTGLSLYAMLELLRIGKPWTKALAVAIFVFMLLGIIFLRFHYTMDVYTAMLTVWITRRLSNQLSPALDRFFERLTLKRGS